MTDSEETTSRHTRIRQAKQVLAGDAIRPSPDPWQAGSDAMPLSPLQRNYLVILGVLLVAGVVMSLTIGLGVASVVLFVLALGLITAWLVF